MLVFASCLSVHSSDIAMSVTEELYDEVLTLFKNNCEEINVLKLKMYKLYTDEMYGLTTNGKLQQQIHQLQGEILRVLARTTMQSCMQKIKNIDNSSGAVNVFVRLSLELVEKKMKHCREIQFKVVEKEPGTLAREYERLENEKMEIELVLKDANHPERGKCLIEMVKNIAKTVAKLNFDPAADDDELKVALCLFELHYDMVDFYKLKIEGLKCCKEREPRESISHENILNEILNHETAEKHHRESTEFRSCLRTIRRLTNGNCTRAVDVRLMMLMQNILEKHGWMKDKVFETMDLTQCATEDLDVLVTAQEDLEQLMSEMFDEFFELSDMITCKDIERRILFTNEIFEKVTKLNDEEIELLDKVIYNEEIHDERCPVCLDEHADGELLVSLRCPCKRERLCQMCALKAMKEKSQCPCCRAYV